MSTEKQSFGERLASQLFRAGYLHSGKSYRTAEIINAALAERPARKEKS